MKGCKRKARRPSMKQNKLKQIEEAQENKETKGLGRKGVGSDREWNTAKQAKIKTKRKLGEGEGWHKE